MMRGLSRENHQGMESMRIPDAGRTNRSRIGDLRRFAGAAIGRIGYRGAFGATYGLRSIRLWPSAWRLDVRVQRPLTQTESRQWSLREQASRMEDLIRRGVLRPCDLSQERNPTNVFFDEREEACGDGGESNG